MRELLHAYYEGAGASDPIAISLPVGTYQPQFARRKITPRPPTIEPVYLGSPSNENAPWRMDAPRERLVSLALFWLFAIVIAIITVFLAALAFRPIFMAGTMDEEEPPVVVVEAPQADGADVYSAALPIQLLQSVESGLSAFDYLDVRRPEFAEKPGARVDYAVRSRFARKGDKSWNIEMRVLREPGGDVIAKRCFEDVAADNSAALDAVVKATVMAAGDIGTGAIFEDLRARLARSKAPLQGYRCYLAGEEYLRDHAEAQRAPARECLEAQVREHPQDYRAMASLAQVLTVGFLRPSPGAKTPEDLDRATILAKRAAELAPFRANSQAALFLTSFYQQHFDEGFRAARQAMALNPYSSLIAISVAKASIARGRIDEGLAILEPLDRAAGGALPSGDAYLSLAALLRGDLDAAYKYAARPDATALPLGVLMRIVTCHQQGMPECVTSAEARLRENFPDFAIDVPAALEHRALAEPIKAILVKDLVRFRIYPDDSGLTARICGICKVQIVKNTEPSVEKFRSEAQSIIVVVATNCLIFIDLRLLHASFNAQLTV